MPCQLLNPCTFAICSPITHPIAQICSLFTMHFSISAFSLLVSEIVLPFLNLPIWNELPKDLRQFAHLLFSLINLSTPRGGSTMNLMKLKRQGPSPSSSAYL